MPITYAGTTLPSGVYHGARPCEAITTFLPRNELRGDMVGLRRVLVLLDIVLTCSGIRGRERGART